MTLVRTLVLVAAFAGFGIAPARTANLLPYDPPEVGVLDSDRTSVTLQVHAGQTGAPAGFIVEWLPADQYQAFGRWPEPPYTSDSKFTGIPTLYVTPGTPSYQLGPDQTVTVVIGKLFDETGVIASAPETGELLDGTPYVVRVRAAASATTPASDFSATLSCATRPRTSTDCTVTLGFWKSHPAAWDRVATVKLGTVIYTNAQLQNILSQPAKGNGLVILAHQQITAKLNQLLGATPAQAVADVIAQADALIGSLVVPPVGGGYLAPGSTRGMVYTLDSFNTGTIGPGHCPKDLNVVGTIQPTWGRLKAIYR
jgi:hypothetical protein